MVSSKVKPVAGENSTVMQKPPGFMLNSGTLPKVMLSSSGKKFVAVMSDSSEKGIKNNISPSNGMIVSDEPNKKRVRLNVVLNSQSDLEGYAASDVRSKHISSDAMSVDSGIDVTNVEFQNSSQHRKINVSAPNSCTAVENSKAETLHTSKSLGNSNILVRGKTNLEVSNKPLKCQKGEKNLKSVYDIIVQHNIAAQGRKSEPKQKVMTRGDGDNENRTVPMVYFPDSYPLNTPRNTNTQEIAAHITKGLVHQAYEDWVHCCIPDENGNM
jgi:hypothetical protein